MGGISSLPVLAVGKSSPGLGCSVSPAGLSAQSDNASAVGYTGLFLPSFITWMTQEVGVAFLG